MTIIHDLNQAKKLLLEEEVVAIPTETVYGLAGSVKSEKALKKIFSVKERPFFDPLIVHVASVTDAKKLTTDWTQIHEILAQHCWPGPLTLLADANFTIINPLITSGLTQVGIRCPSHPLTLELLKDFPEGLAAPSANKFGKTSPTSAQHVEDEFRGLVNVLDGGHCSVGIESTVVGISFDEQWIISIYRSGFYHKENLAKLLIDNGINNFIINYAQSPVAPGQLEHHYMPKTPILFQPTTDALSKYPRILSWTTPEDPSIVARILYQKFRDFSEHPFDAILINIPSSVDLNDERWQGVLNRLKKAAQK